MNTKALNQYRLTFGNRFDVSERNEFVFLLVIRARTLFSKTYEASALMRVETENVIFRLFGTDRNISGNSSTIE